MTITRLWLAGAELQHVNELTEYSGYGSASVSVATSSTKAKTGTYSFRFDSNNLPRGKVVSTTQLRAGFFLNHAGLTGASGKGILGLINSTVGDIIIQWYGTGDVVELLVNGTIRDTDPVATVGIVTQNTWYHIGIAAKADATNGWVSVYVDGVLRLTWIGNTGTNFTGVFFAGRNSGTSSGWNTFAYVDDFYVDSTVGEADAAPPSPRFSFLPVNGAGNYTNWTPNTGTNSGAVDDSGAPNDDTDYVYATAAAVKDSYALVNTTAGVTVPSGYSIEAVIPVAWARKTDAGTASTLKLGTRLSSTDLVGSAQTLATAYGPIMERQTAKPGGGAWSTSDVDSAEFYAESAGSY